MWLQTRKSLWAVTSGYTNINKFFALFFFDLLAIWVSVEGRAAGGFLSDLHEQVCKLNLGWFRPLPHSWQCDWSVSWLLEIIGEAHIWQELLLFLLSLYCPATALPFTSKEALCCVARVQSVSDFFFILSSSCRFWFIITFPLPLTNFFFVSYFAAIVSVPCQAF